MENGDTFWWVFTDAIIDILFVSDMFLCFFTVYSNEYEDYEVKRRKIAMNYLKGWFFFDVVAVLPISYFFTQNGGINDLARVARLPRLYKMIKVFRILRQTGKLQKYATEVLQIGMVIERAISFIFVIFLVTHIFSCLWYFLARWNNFDPETWVSKTGFSDESDTTIYIYCFYFVIQVLTTVGYGDIQISKTDEKITAMIIMGIGVITFSFAFGSLMSVLTNLNSRAAKLKKMTFELNSIKKKYRVSGDLYNKLFRALKFEIQQDENIENFISTLPTILKSEVTLAVNNKIISRLPYFKYKKANFCAQAASLLQSSKTFMGDMVFQKDEKIYEIFFLLKGKAGYVVQENNITVVYSKIKGGQLFGELDFFPIGEEIPNAERHFTVRALSD